MSTFMQDIFLIQTGLIIIIITKIVIAMLTKTLTLNISNGGLSYTLNPLPMCKREFSSGITVQTSRKCHIIDQEQYKAKKRKEKRKGQGERKGKRKNS